MPLPNYGYDNREKKTHQDIVFEMAPEIVSDDEDTTIVNGKKVKRVRGKVTRVGARSSALMLHSILYLQISTGKVAIDLERTLKINAEKDPNVWKTQIDPK